MACVVDVMGPPGIGKSRLVREATALARRRGVEVFSDLLRVACQPTSRSMWWRGCCARPPASRISTTRPPANGCGRGCPTADPQDVLLLDDLLGIADPDVALPKIDPDARRRRLTALINAASLARTEPAVFVIEDVHWIDEVSESMLADFLTVIPQTPSMVLITYRPEYRGALTRMHGAQTIALAPLTESETAALLDELLGPIPLSAEMAALIAERAAGNPFFAEEMVRELAERGVLQGRARRLHLPHRRRRGECARHAAGDHRRAHRPARARGQTDVQRRGGDRIALRHRSARRAGHRPCPSTNWSTPSWSIKSGSPRSRVRFPPSADPHRGLRIPAEIRSCPTAPPTGRRDRSSASPASADENAALIAEHLEAAGDLHAAYRLAHARRNVGDQPRHRRGATELGARPSRSPTHCPPRTPDRTAMRIAPRTMLCGIAWRVHVNVAGDRFEELRELCTAAGDKASLAIAMAGLVIDHAFQARIREASQLASEAMALIESIGDPTLTVGLSFAGDLRQGWKAASGMTCCGGHSGSSTWPTATRPKATSSSGLRWRSPLRRGLLPGIAWVVPDGATTCGTAWPWPAAPTRCPTPGPLPTSTSPGIPHGVLGPTIGRCARSRMRCGLPNDPVMTSRWPSPG